MGIKKILPLLLLPLLFLAGCSDEPEQGLLPEEVASEMRLLADEVNSDITTFIESEGVKGATNLLDLIQEYDFTARANQTENVKEQILSIAQYFVYGSSNSDDDPIVFDDIKGLYKWNPLTETFDKVPSEFFIVLFPVEDAETNNAKLEITDLQFITLGEEELPTIIVSYLEIDGIRVVNLDFEVIWLDSDFPDEAKIDLFVDPFTFTLRFNNTFQNATSLVSSLELDDEVILFVDTNIEFQSNEKEVLKSLEGFVQYDKLKISGTISGTEFDNSNINDFVNLELYLDDEKVGDIVFEEDLACVVYSDGSKELLEEMVKPVLEEIESLLADFE